MWKEPDPGGGGGGEGDDPGGVGGEDPGGGGGGGGWDGNLPTSIPFYKPVSVSNREWHDKAGHVWSERVREKLRRQNQQVRLSLFLVLFFIY